MKPVSFALSMEEVSGLPEAERLQKLVERLNKGSTFVNGAMANAVTVAENLAATISTIEVQMPASEWVTPTLAGTWVAYNASTHFTAQYRVDYRGNVELRGHVKNGAGIPETLFTLPAALAPAKRLDFAVASNSAFGMVAVATTGAVSAEVGNTAWVSLNGISFQPSTLTHTPSSAFPIIYQTKLNNQTFRPVGVVILRIYDKADNRLVPYFTSCPDWEPCEEGVKIKNISGLTYGRSYSVTLLNLAG